MLKATLGQILVNEALPKEYRDYKRVIKGNALDDLLGVIAREQPAKYKEVTHKLLSLGADFATSSSVSVGLDDLASPIDRSVLFDQARKATRNIQRSNLSKKEKKEEIEKVYSILQKRIMDTTYSKALKSNNMFARQVEAKARGNPMQLAGMISTPSFYRDAKDNAIPIFIERSFAEGLRPYELWAAAYGARKGVKSTKFATRDGGDLGKQLTNSMGRLTITKNDCGDIDGVDMDTDDDDNIGSLLATKAGPFKAGTIITPKVLQSLRKKGIKTVSVRSPLNCKAKGGICAKCAGVRENNKLPEVGYSLGVVAGSALAERVAQGALNVKHSSGQKLKGDDRFTGFNTINQMTQIPKNYPNKAALAELDGRVQKIEPAPQGGQFVYINDKQHYIPSTEDLKVKVGSIVEAGDQIATGLINPAELVKYKGIGEARRLFTKHFTSILKASGLTSNRRNIEVASRALIDNIDITDEDNIYGHLPGDRISYSRLAYNYKPRKTATVNRPEASVNRYLEQPVLHYSIGTRITPSVAKLISKKGYNKILTDEREPGFTPEMIRLRSQIYEDPDWLAKTWGSNLKGNLLRDTHLNRSTNLTGTHPIPRIVNMGIDTDHTLYDTTK